MSDYLQRLVERSVDPPDAIRPRPLGLFEAASTGSAPTAPVPGEYEHTEATRPPADRDRLRPDASPREVAVVQVPVPAAVPVSPPVLPTLAVPLTEPAAVRPVPATVTAPEPPRVRAHDTANAQPRMSSPPERARSQPAPPPLLQRTIVQPLQREVIVERRADAGRRPAEARRERPPPQVGAAEPSSPRSRVNRVPPPQPEPRSGLIRPLVTTPPAPVPRSRRDSQSPAEPAAASTVHVTIGRVEVRAVQPAAAARNRPAAARPAVMSLDEYLKQRAGQRAGGDRS